jgi:hypothetical protein
LPPETLAAAQAKGHARTLAELVTDVLDQPRALFNNA